MNAPTTKPTLPQRVTKPKVQRHRNLSATVVRGPKVENGEVRWYWRIDRCANAALGVTERETVYHKWATVEQAQSELADLVVRGAYRPQMEVGGRRIVTFADMLDAEAEARGEPAHLHPATIGHWGRWRRWLKEQLGHKIILQTSRDELERLFISHINAGRAHSTVSRAAGWLSIAWQWAYEERLVTTRPPPLKLGRSFREPKPTPNRDQIAAIVNTLNGEAKLVVQVLAVTGARLGEIVSLRRCDYDPLARCLKVNGKTGPRRVPLDESVRAQIVERADGTTAPMFYWTTATPGPVNRMESWVRRTLKIACRRLKLPRFSPHSLRRAAVNFFIDQGYDPKVIATFLGHSVKVLMQHYRTPTPDAVERMVTSARPGDFSTTSPARRRALDTLPELLKDAALMADPRARDALTTLLNALGASQGEAPALPPEQAERPEQAEEAEAGAGDQGAGPSVEADPNAAHLPTPHVTPHSRDKLAVTARMSPSSSLAAAQPRRPLAPGAPALPKPAAALTQPSVPTDEGKRGLPSASPLKRGLVPVGQRPVVGAPTAPCVEPPSAPPAHLSRRAGQLVPRQEPQRGPSRAPIDKLAKG